MQRFRYGGRSGSWLALIAVAVQLAISFGHVHLDGIGRMHPAAAAIGRPALAAQPLPAQQPGDNDGYCAICASLYLAAHSFVPPPPLLPAPPVSTAIARIAYGAAMVMAPRRLAFQSRAPPPA